MPFLKKNYYINFYGGEPLLSFDLIKKTTAFLKNENRKHNKRVKYSITTNGSLLNEEIIRFLHENKFSIELSFDGLAQDILRKKGSFKKIISFIDELLKQPNIDLETNSVFSPDTVSYLSKSIKFIMGLGIADINFSLSVAEPWDEVSLVKLENEMTKLRKIVISYFKNKGDIPVKNFKEIQEKGIFFCSAGQDRLAITPEGRIWGCFLFPEYFKVKEKSSDYKKFHFGNVDNFIENNKYIYPHILQNYTHLSMDNFHTFKMKCFLCPEIVNCVVCPVISSFSGANLFEVPDYICRIQKIKMNTIKKFREEMKKNTLDII